METYRYCAGRSALTVHLFHGYSAFFLHERPRVKFRVPCGYVRIAIRDFKEGIENIRSFVSRIPEAEGSPHGFSGAAFRDGYSDGNIEVTLSLHKEHPDCPRSYAVLGIEQRHVTQ